MELKASPISVIAGAFAAHLVQNPAQPNLCQRQRLGVPIKSDQVSFGPQLPENRFGMPGKAHRAVHIRPIGPHAEKINRFM